MTNAQLFKKIFGIYATELWSMNDKEFFNWLYSEVDNKVKDKKQERDLHED